MLQQRIPGIINQDLADRELKPNMIRDALNSMFQRDGTDITRRESMFGTRLINNSKLPLGNNVCVGVLPFSGRSAVYFFTYNSNGNHGVWEYSQKTESIKKLLVWSGLDFTEDTNITGIGLVGNILVWGEEDNETRSIDLSLVDEGYYNTNLSERKISYLKEPYKKRPFAAKGLVDPNNTSKNLIAHNSYRVIARYTYKDGGLSVFSPYSKIVPAETDPQFEYKNPLRNLNRIITRLFITQDELDLLRTIEFAFHRDNEPEMYIFERVEASEVQLKAPFGQPSETYLEVDWANNTETITVNSRDANTVAEVIPRRSKALAGFFNRVVLNNLLSGYSGFPETFNIRPRGQLLTKDVNDFGNDSTTTFKSEGEYAVGVVFYDEKFRRTGVRGVKNVTTPDWTTWLNTGPVGINDKLVGIQVDVTGIAPPNVTKWQLFCSKELTQTVYFQCPVGMFFYVADDDPGLGAEQFVLRDRFYRKNLPEFRTQYAFIHLIMPINTPFLPDTNCYVRVKYGLNGNAIDAKVLEVLDGDILVVEPFGLPEDFRSQTQTDLMIEVYLPKSDRNTMFYAASEVYDLNSAREFSVNGVNLKGDMWLKEVTAAKQTSFRWESDVFAIGSETESGGADPYTSGVPDSGGLRIYRVETMSPVVDQTVEDTSARLELVQWRMDRGQGIGDDARRFAGSERIITVSEKKPILNEWGFGKMQVDSVAYGLKQINILPGTAAAFDYNKTPEAFGRANAVVQQEKELSIPNEIRYSLESTQGGAINRIFNFNTQNTELLPYDRGDLVALVPAHTVLLAIHEHKTTSLYIREGFLKQTDGGDVSVASDNFIGNQRPVKAEYGTINPESVVEHDGRVYFWDYNRAEWCRYSTEGIVPLGKTFGMSKFFNQVKEIYQQNGKIPKAYGGYDPLRETAYLSIEPVEVNKSEEFPGFTIMFSEKAQGFVGFTSFIPERMTKVGNSLVSFKNGKLYVHDDRENRNVFYGTKYSMEHSFLANQDFDFEKLFQNINIGGTNNGVWSAEITNSRGQETNLLPSEFIIRDDQLYADIKKDTKTPSDLLPINAVAKLSGKDIEDEILELKLINSSNVKTELNELHVGYIIKSGHLIDAQRGVPEKNN